MGLPSRDSLPTAMRPPEDHWRNGPFRCVPASTYLSSFENISPYNEPFPSSLFQALMPPTVTPVPPNYTQTYGYPSNNPLMTGFKDTYETRRGSPESHESHSSEPQTANTSFSQPHEKDDVYERTQLPIHEQTKHKNLHRGRERKKIDPCGPFKCKWEDCRYPGVFARKAVLMRHIETQHVTPRSFECPDKLCDRSFNRKDNMEEHWRRVH